MSELYVVARSVLLDALEALGAHRAAVIVVGAHAVYLRVGEADLAVAPYTTDGDLAIDPATLGQLPPIEELLVQNDFHRAPNEVGIWSTRRTVDGETTTVVVDLLVPESVAPGAGRRAARLPGHDDRAARKVQGLEGALADADPMSVTALDPSDGRAIDVRVAGPASLLVAKVHKIDDRESTSRETDKDALDVLRLLRGTETDELARRMNLIRGDARSEIVADKALELFRDQFGRRSGPGIEMAVRATAGLVGPEEIAASCEALATDLLAALGLR